jgi:hypothetical protein
MGGQVWECRAREETNADPAEGHATFPATASGCGEGVRPDADTRPHASRRNPCFPVFSREATVGTALAMHVLRRTTRRAKPTQETTMTIRLFRPAHAQRALDGLKVFSIFAASAATGLMLGLTRLNAG